MKTKKVRDLMIPIDMYASVHKDATLLDAILTIYKSQQKLSDDQQPIRSVLVVDNNKNIIGKIGHLAFLKALEPKYNNIIDFEKLTRAGVSPAFISSMTENLRLWDDDFVDILKRPHSIRVTDVMHPVSDCIDENAPLSKAIHHIIIMQSLSMLVTGGSKIVGILRLSDLYDEIAQNIIDEHEKNEL
ncbi:CBS domain-containing protein [candidate division KSB1 bacterium]